MSNAGNEAQKRAICHGSGPMLVLAGPGSGKTFVITNRIRFLTRSLGAQEQHILVISFSRASALEMKERFLRLTGKASTAVSFGTFHAVFFQILKNEYHLKAADLLSASEKKDIFREALELSLRRHKERDGIFSQLWQLKESFLSADGDASDVTSEFLEAFSREKNTGACMDHETFLVSREVYNILRDTYEEIVQKRRKLDFDDMLVKCLKLLQKRPDILSTYQQQFQYILIDEFQDINPVQFEVIRMLALPQNNLFVVGDDDQSIYSFRGASPEIMLHFKEYYPLAKQELLTINYRCSGPILQAADALIRENKNRYEKQVVAKQAEGEPVEVLHLSTTQESCEAIVSIIREHLNGGGKKEGKPSGIAVLFRKSGDMEDMMRALDKAGIPYRKKEEKKNLHQSFIAEDLRSYIRYIEGDHSEETFLKIMNKPYRYLHRDQLRGEVFPPDNTLYRRLLLSDSREQKRRMALEAFIRDISLLKRMPPFLFCNYLRKGLGYERYLKNLCELTESKKPGMGKKRYKEYLAILDQLQESMKEQRKLRDWLLFSEEEAKKEETGKTDEAPRIRDGITLMTYHASKGLEFDLVFLPALQEGIVPHGKAVTLQAMEEERRMLYVAMTRAKKKLYLLYADTASESSELSGRQPGQFQQLLQPSRFLKALEGQSSNSSKSILSRYSSKASAACSYSSSSSI